jgi:hypothetical protein
VTSVLEMMSVLEMVNTLEEVSTPLVSAPEVLNTLEVCPVDQIVKILVY